MNAISLFFLVSVAIGGIAWVFIYPLLSGEKKAEKRKESVARATPAVRAAAAVARNTRSRREQVEGSLKELEAKQAKSPPLSARISQAGLSWSIILNSSLSNSARPEVSGVVPLSVAGMSCHTMSPIRSAQ